MKNTTAILTYFGNNEGTFADVLEALDDYSCNSLLRENRYHDMDELDDELDDYSATEIIEMGQGFDTGASYFRKDGDTIEAYDWKDYSEWLTEETVKSIIDNRHHLDLPYHVDDVLDMKPLLTKDERDFLRKFSDTENMSIYVNEDETPYLRIRQTFSYFDIPLEYGSFAFLEAGEEVSFAELLTLGVEGE